MPYGAPSALKVFEWAEVGRRSSTLYPQELAPIQRVCQSWQGYEHYHEQIAMGMESPSSHIPGKSASPVGQQAAWTHRVTSSATRPLQPIKDIPSCIRNSLLIFVGR
ncbi:hypothetical protein LI328DRAFT_171428 [Trichoderma asperelloides]|nr:hypothetical protein LI328DRAFT_171428 [Trichoderma asperelloides]